MNDTFMKEKPIFPLLTSMALPMVVSMLVNALYNIVDSLFVARISEEAMTALSLVYPVQNLINAIAIGFSIGIAALISLHLGAGNKEKADMAATHGMVLSLIHGVVISIVCTAIMPRFLRSFTSDETVIAMGVTYSRVAFMFAVVIMAAMSFEKIFQAVGRMNITMIGLMGGSVCNIILDPLLIFGIGPFPKMGIAGAALATGIGQMVPVIFYLIVYFVSPIPVRLRSGCLKPDAKMALQLYSIGVPATLNLALPSVLITFLNSLLAVYSQSYVVVLGIYYKLQTFLYLPANGIVQGLRPIIGYNYGAGEYDRVKKLYRTSMGMCAAIMAVGTVLCLALSGQLIGLFSSNAETIVIGTSALRIICVGFIVSTISVVASGSLEGLGMGVQSLVISLCRYIVVIIPLAWLFCRLLGADGIWNAFWVTEVITAGISMVVYHKSGGLVKLLQRIRLDQVIGIQKVEIFSCCLLNPPIARGGNPSVFLTNRPDKGVFFRYIPAGSPACCRRSRHPPQAPQSPAVFERPSSRGFLPNIAAHYRQESQRILLASSCHPLLSILRQKRQARV